MIACGLTLTADMKVDVEVALVTLLCVAVLLDNDVNVEPIHQSRWKYTVSCARNREQPTPVDKVFAARPGRNLEASPA